MLRDIREGGLTLEVQQQLAGDDTLLRAVLSTMQCKLDDACAAQEVALTEASQSKQDCAAALATGECSFLVRSVSHTQACRAGAARLWQV